MKPTQSDRGYEKALEAIEGFFLTQIDHHLVGTGDQELYRVAQIT